MRNPEQVLNILAEYSKEPEYKYERLYRILFNEQMFHVAYQRIYAKPGNMTPGTDGKTEDGMSLERIDKLISGDYPQIAVEECLQTVCCEVLYIGVR